MNAQKPLPDWFFFVCVAVVAIAFYLFMTWDAPQAPKRPKLSKEELLETVCNDLRSVIIDLQQETKPDGTSIERTYRMLRDLDC